MGGGRMRGFLRHLQVRLAAVLRSPMALLMVLFLAVAGTMMSTVFRPTPMTDMGPVFDVLFRTLMIWMFPFMVAIFITGWLWTLGEGSGLGTMILPTLPVSPRTRILAETTGGLILLAAPFLAVALILGAVTDPGSTWRSVVNLNSLAEDGLIGILVLLPVLVACIAPTGKEWFNWVRSLVTAIIMAVLVTAGLTRGLAQTAVVGLGMTTVILWLYRLGPAFDLESLVKGNGSPRLYRPGLPPEVRFRRDLWRRPVRKFWPALVAMLLITFVVPPLVNWLGIPETLFVFSAGILPGLMIHLLMFPLGIHLFNGDRGITGSGGNRGTFQQAWAYLPLPYYQVLRGVWLHGIISGLICWVLYVTHFVLMMAFNDEWTAIVWFHVSLVLVIPAGAGFLVAGAAGDGLRLTLAIAALIGIPVADIGFTIGLKSAGVAMSQNQQIFVVFAVALAATLIGGLPPLIHLRRPRPQGAQGR